MKISKKLGLLVAAGAFIIVFAGLFMVYSGRAGERDKLNEQLNSVQLRLNGIQLGPLSARQAELEGQLGQTTSQFEVAKALLSQPDGSVNVTSVLFNLAKASHLAVTGVASPGPTTEDREGVTFSVLPLTVKVEGTVPNLVSFTTRLNSYFATGIVKSVIITVSGLASSDNTSTGSGNASAEIQLAVYSYQGG